MRFSITATSVALAMFAACLLTRADIIAFSGSTCNGDEGDNVACDDTCVDFRNRHSFDVLASGTHCVVVFEDTGCSTPVGSISNPGGGTCSNVNTGTNVQSFRCSPNGFCDTVAKGNVTIAGTAKPAVASGSA